MAERNKQPYFWGVKEQLLEETSYIVSKPDRVVYFWVGFFVGVAIGVGGTLGIVWLVATRLVIGG